MAKKQGGGELTAAAKKMGKKGGLAGGPARAKVLSASERKSIAVQGGKARQRQKDRS